MKRWIISRLFVPVRRTAAWIVAVLLLFLILGSPLGPGMWNLARNAFGRLTERIITIQATGPVIVEKLQSLNRLETARQVSRHVIEAKSEPNLLPAFLVKDRLLMLAQTEVVAGVELARLSERDIEVKDKAVVLRLPAPQLLAIHIEDDHSQVYSRERGWFVLNPDKDLERQARLKARTDARQAALESGVLSHARTNAEINLRGILQSLGFEKVEFQWIDLPVPTTPTDNPVARAS